MRMIAASVSRYPAGGPDPLEEAWQAIQERSYRSRYDLFIALVRELLRRRGDQPIVLPLKRIAELMKCDWSSVRGYRQTATREGTIYKVADPIPHRRAAQYRVSVQTPSKTIPTIPTIPITGLVGIPIVGIEESPIVGIEGAEPPIVGIEADEVLRLVARGFQIFPVEARGKKPLVRWKTEATSNAEQVRKWIEKFPGCNWGIATGERSRIFVLDVDGPEGLQSFADLCANAGENWKSIAETTLGVRTGKGSQLYFEYPGPTKNTVGKLADGVDTRGDGGYVVCPPSVHQNCEAYAWLGGEGSRKISNAPDWLIDRLNLCSSRRVAEKRESPAEILPPGAVEVCGEVFLSPDPDRFRDFKNAIMAAWQAMYGRCPWSALEDKWLSDLLQADATVTVGELGGWLENFNQSEDHPKFVRASYFLKRAHNYSIEPLDKYGRSYAAWGAPAKPWTNWEVAPPDPDDPFAVPFDEVIQRRRLKA